MLASDQSFEEVDGNKYMNSSAITWGAAGLRWCMGRSQIPGIAFTMPFDAKESFATSGPRMTSTIFLLVMVWIQVKDQ